MKSRDQLVDRLCEVRGLATKKEGKKLLKDVLDAIVSVLETNIEQDKFELKLSNLGKLSVHHRKGAMRRIPITGESIMTKDRKKVRFNALGKLRKLERQSTK